MPETPNPRPTADYDALLAAVWDLLRTADQPTSHSATARVNAGALDRLRAAERAFSLGGSDV